MVQRLVILLLAAIIFQSPAVAGVSKMPPGLAAKEFQRFVDSVVYGDTLSVPPGNYQQIVLRSGVHVVAEGGPDVTVVWTVLANDVDSLAVLEGFHARGKSRPVAVITAENSFATFRDCVIEGGWAGVQGRYGDIRLEGCRILDCDTGVHLYESKSLITGSEITQCGIGVTLTSSATRIIRSEISHNTTGVSISEHSDPSIGGSLATSNRFIRNTAGHIKNDSYVKKSGVRTWEPMIINVPYNSWGTDCPSKRNFRGDVEYTPWVDAAGKAVFEECPPPAPAPAAAD